jgi:hypothetical protein
MPSLTMLELNNLNTTTDILKTLEKRPNVNISHFQLKGIKTMHYIEQLKKLSNFVDFDSI